jgi:hypothetical protein
LLHVPPISRTEMIIAYVSLYAWGGGSVLTIFGAPMLSVLGYEWTAGALLGATAAGALGVARFIEKFHPRRRDGGGDGDGEHVMAIATGEGEPSPVSFMQCATSLSVF